MTPLEEALKKLTESEVFKDALGELPDESSRKSVRESAESFLYKLLVPMDILHERLCGSPDSSREELADKLRARRNRP